MLSTLRSNKKRECPTGLELLGFRARGPKAVRVTNVKHFVDAPVPFVAISTDGEYEHGVMDREGLRKAEREGFRLRYMNNPATAWHWSHVYAATPQQLNQPNVRLSGQACLLVGPMEQRGPTRGMFPTGCIAWIPSSLFLPGEVKNVSWLDFYPAVQHEVQPEVKTPSSQWRRRAARQRATPTRARGHRLEPVPEQQPLPEPLPEAERALTAKSLEEAFKAIDEEMGSGSDDECVICMNAAAEYSWEVCDHHRPLLCIICVKATLKMRNPSSCVMCRKVSRLVVYQGCRKLQQPLVSGAHL